MSVLQRRVTVNAPAVSNRNSSPSRAESLLVTDGLSTLTKFGIWKASVLRIAEYEPAGLHHSGHQPRLGSFVVENQSGSTASSILRTARPLDESALQDRTEPTCRSSYCTRATKYFVRRFHMIRYTRVKLRRSRKHLFPTGTSSQPRHSSSVFDFPLNKFRSG